MLCRNCPYHRYEVGFEDADETCDVFYEFPDDERSRKDGEGCIFNLRTLKKKKAEMDEEVARALDSEKI